jgi:twitching motility protein PilT
MEERRPIDATRLGALLLENPLVREEDLERCLEIQTMTGGGRPLGQILLEQGVITAALLDELLALQAERRRAVQAFDQYAETIVTGGVERFLISALQAKANELILSEGRPALMRVGGQLQSLGTEPVPSPEIWQFVTDYIGPDALDLVAQNKSLTRELRRPGYCRGRISAFRQFDGICVTLRLHPDKVREPDRAGIPPQALDMLRGGKGLVLVAGQSHAGVSETMTTMLRTLVGDKNRFVLVLDDCDEIPDLGGEAIVVRRQVGRHTHSYATGLRASIRQRPDVIVVGDATDAETFDLALRSAEAGCLVIAGIAARSAASAINRALDGYPPQDVPRVRSTLASVLRGVLVVQLVPSVKRNGLTLATEVLVMDEAAQGILRDGVPGQLELLTRLERRSNGHSLDDSLIELVRSGRVKLEDAFQYADDRVRVLQYSRIKIPL